METETRGEKVVLFDLNWEQACPVTQIFPYSLSSANDCENPLSIEWGLRTHLLRR